MDVFTFALWVGQVIDFFGVLVIFLGVILSTFNFVKDYILQDNPKMFKTYRENLGKTILLGLEILVAGDILRSIVGRPDWTSVAILGAIVLIRTFLSVAFDMEITGHWPWKRS